MFELEPNAGDIYEQLLLDAQILREDPSSYLPDGLARSMSS